jgi:NAD(P)-dependent dehydrogenase (short-subunit alcohol dehydrogenase family)
VDERRRGGLRGVEGRGRRHGASVAQEVLEHGVRINAILPSTMDTPANRRAMPDADPAKWVPLESASAVIAFLLSEDSRDVSGAALPVYGRS